MTSARSSWRDCRKLACFRRKVPADLGSLRGHLRPEGHLRCSETWILAKVAGFPSEDPRSLRLLVRDLSQIRRDLRTLPDELRLLIEELRSFADDLRLLIGELRKGPGQLRSDPRD